jgi:hypothetical protein
VLTNFQKMMIEDLSGPNSYGQPLVGWKGQIQFFKNTTAPANPLGPLDAKFADTFVEQVFFLLATRRSVTLYRGFETAGLQAPFGKDHPSFIYNVLASRKPGKPDGQWWTPRRPSASIDNLRLSDLHRGEDRDSSSITLQWNRLDYYLEGELRVGSLVYVGRAAPQQETELYGGDRYGGGSIQFRLPRYPQQMLSDLKCHVAA